MKIVVHDIGTWDDASAFVEENPSIEACCEGGTTSAVGSLILQHPAFFKNFIGLDGLEVECIKDYDEFCKRRSAAEEKYAAMLEKQARARRTKSGGKEEYMVLRRIAVEIVDKQ